MHTLKKIQSALKHLANPDDAVFLSKFFKTGPGQYGEGDRFRGIRVPQLRKLAAEFVDTSLNQLEILLHSPWHEDRMLALFILTGKYRRGDDRNKTAIYRLYLRNTRFVNNWDLVDASAPNIPGAYLYEKNTSPLSKLAVSDSLWERRIAVVATFYFIKRGRFQETLKIVEMLLKDNEDLIHKASGWMLREVGKRDLHAEEVFLAGHVKKMPRTMLRYAIEKFPEKKRLKYLRA